MDKKSGRVKKKYIMGSKSVQLVEKSTSLLEQVRGHNCGAEKMNPIKPERGGIFVEKNALIHNQPPPFFPLSQFSHLTFHISHLAHTTKKARKLRAFFVVYADRLQSSHHLSSKCIICFQFQCFTEVLFCFCSITF